MTALATACRVLAWAASQPSPPGAVGRAVEPPVGPLWGVAELAYPDPDAVQSLRYLCSAVAARLGASTPPFGDPAPIGPGALLLAASIGGRTEPLALALTRAAPPLRLSRHAGWAEALARHGVVGPFVTRPGRPAIPQLVSAPAPTPLAHSGRGHIEPERAAGASADAPAPVGQPEQTEAGDVVTLTDALLEASPLTMVLHHPPATATRLAEIATDHLLARPAGRSVLAAAFSAPTRDPAVLSWRASVLVQLRHRHPAALLDVYRAARLWHGPAWDAQIAAVKREVTGIGLPGELAIAALRFWQPLAAVDRDDEQSRGLAAVMDQTYTRAGAPSLAGRVFLRRAECWPVLELVNRYRGLLLGGVAG